jgi:hypothetical protein
MHLPEVVSPEEWLAARMRRPHGGVIPAEGIIGRAQQRG